ncbi:MAG: hypothetical protein KatS3mg132_360 [Limisphaera sp.]|nr:MAG: hypothetical protein KatS3mg132_360 [Limisphaera sp.]
MARAGAGVGVARVDASDAGDLPGGIDLREGVTENRRLTIRIRGNGGG